MNFFLSSLLSDVVIHRSFVVFNFLNHTLDGNKFRLYIFFISINEIDDKKPLDPISFIIVIIYRFYYNSILFLFSLNSLYRTKWKRQTAVGLELFVEAGNYAAYQRAYAARYGQMDGLPSYPTNPLMMPGAGHPLGLQPSNLSSVESYYQQILQNGMNGIASQHASMFAAPHRPLAMVPQIPGTGFLPLSPPNSLYATSRLPSTSPPQRPSPEQQRPNSLSPAASSLPSHSPKTSQPWPKQPSSTTHNVSDDESDIEV